MRAIGSTARRPNRTHRSQPATLSFNRRDRYGYSRPYENGLCARLVLQRAGRIAPTAANLQPFHLIVVTDTDTRARMKTVYARDWFYSAPVIVVGCVEPAKAWQRADGFNAAELD